MPFRTRKALALLVYLAVEPRPHPRDLLAEMFWSRTSPSEARHSLANAISEIRRRLGKAAVETALDRVRLRGDVVALDLERLLAGDVLGNEVDGPLEVDGFLEGFDLPDATGFALWKEAQRGGLVTPLRDALVKLIDRARRTGNFPELGRLGERLARFDELSEDAIRARMESRAFAGDRLGALRLYEQWKTELANQMGAMPSDLLEGMSLRLRRRGWERPGSVDVPAVRTEHWRDRAFVGREREYRELYEAWDATRAGEPQHRLLLGDSGVGKSTLVDRFASVAALEGAAVVRTQCHELEQGMPYAAASELISQLADHAGAGATPPEQLAELAQHIPAIRKRFESLPTPIATQGEASRVRFCEAAFALVQAVAEEHPLILVVDDVHNCDDVSLTVLHYVLRRLGQQPTMSLFLARPSELKRSMSARRLLDQGPLVGIKHLEVEPLGDSAMNALLHLLLQDDPDKYDIVTRRALVRASGGIPLVLELLLRELKQEGGTAATLAMNAISPATVERDWGSPANETYRLLLDRLFSGLEGDTRMVLYTAAILGRHLNEPGMYALADLSAAQMMHGLGHLTAFRVLRDGGNGLEFANDLVRTHAYMSVPLSMRRHLHGRIADELLLRAERGDRNHGLDIAWHCVRSGRIEEGMLHLLEGAKRAVQRGATHEAEFRLRSALDLFKGQARTEAILTLALLVQEQGRWEDSLEVIGLDDSAAQSTLGGLYRKTAQLSLNQLLPSELEETLSVARSAIRSAGSDQRIAPAIAGLALSIQGSALDARVTADALALLEEAKQLPLSDQEEDSLALASLQLRFGLGMSPQERVLALEAAENMAFRTNAWKVPSARSYRIVTGIGILNGTLGRFEAAIKPLEAAAEIAQRLDNPRRLAGALGNLAINLSWLGQFQRQRELAARSLAVLGSTPTRPYSHFVAAYEYALAAVILGDHAAAERVIEEQRVRLSPTASDAMRQVWVLHEADIWEMLDKQDRALRCTLEALEIGDYDVLGTPVSCGAASRAALRLLRDGKSGDRLRASQLLEKLWAGREVLETGEVLELSCAYLLAFPAKGQRGGEAWTELRDRLAHLPASVTRRLTALGTPPPQDCQRYVDSLQASGPSTGGNASRE